MTREECERITTDRLVSWGRRCAECHSTPYLMLAFGHNHVSGRPLLIALEDSSGDQIVDALYGVLLQLRPELGGALRRRPRKGGT